MLSEFDIQCVNQKSVKGRAISEALADGLILGDEFDDNFLDEHLLNIGISRWKMYFDGAFNRRGNGAGVLLIDPYGIHIPFAVKLSFPTTNNMAEYEACIYGVKFIPYFEDINFKHLPREQNSFTDALANLAVNLTWENNVKIRAVTIEENDSPVVNLEHMIAALTLQDDKYACWGIDIIGQIHPNASNGHQYILVSIDYFSKWIEAASYVKLGEKQVSKFVINNIICRYGVPFEIISDNGSHFEGHLKETLEKYKVRHHQSSPYRPQTNGAVEVANKTIRTIIAKMTEKTREWPEKFPYSLWGYMISIRTPTGTTAYSLVYGMEPVLPVEIEIQSLRVMNESEISEDQWCKVRYDELTLVDERRLEALNNIQLYQRRIARAFNKRVRDRGIQEGI
ncbi:uncharacterized protein [Spinacia oleracea]|uniref:Integrase catalytic domain-containing protein n=1 Tax=Spinacia oleracea TaxID=3562 RepID=A0ABM3R8L6_SPIOL|nr:uncharacterized protein LOC130467463 [Spinacia oleracea]